MSHLELAHFFGAHHCPDLFPIGSLNRHLSKGARPCTEPLLGVALVGPAFFRAMSMLSCNQRFWKSPAAPAGTVYFLPGPCQLWKIWNNKQSFLTRDLILFQYLTVHIGEWKPMWTYSHPEGGHLCVG